MNQATRTLALAALTLQVVSCAEPPAPPQLPPPPVTVEVPLVRDVVTFQDFTGRTAAVASVEVRARASGYLDAMHYDIATDVEKGEPLFTIERDSYQALRDSAAAALASAEANAKRAQADLERSEEAVQSNAISKSEYALRIAERDMAEASVMEAKANLADAELNLSYCNVMAPISGQVSRNYVDVGNLVGGPEATLLCDVVQMDPMFVYFEASEADVLRHMQDNENRGTQRLKNPIRALLGLGNDKTFPHEGLIDYLDNRVDSNTSTLEIRGTFPNSDRSLFPGLFARIRIPGETLKDAVLVREEAVGTDLGGKFVMTVDDQNVVGVARVELGQIEDGYRLIVSGLEAGQRYIVEGTQRARPGMPVTVMNGGAPGGASAPPAGPTDTEDGAGAADGQPGDAGEAQGD